MYLETFCKHKYIMNQLLWFVLFSPYVELAQIWQVMFLLHTPNTCTRGPRGPLSPGIWWKCNSYIVAGSLSTWPRSPEMTRGLPKAWISNTRGWFWWRPPPNIYHVLPLTFSWPPLCAPAHVCVQQTLAPYHFSQWINFTRGWSCCKLS